MKTTNWEALLCVCVCVCVYIYSFKNTQINVLNYKIRSGQINIEQHFIK